MYFQVHNPLQLLVLNRVKNQLGYPEAEKDMVKPKSLFTGMFFLHLVSGSYYFLPFSDEPLIISLGTILDGVESLVGGLP
jgi:hypothetical protein